MEVKTKEKEERKIEKGDLFKNLETGKTYLLWNNYCDSKLALINLDGLGYFGAYNNTEELISVLKERNFEHYSSHNYSLTLEELK